MNGSYNSLRVGGEQIKQALYILCIRSKHGVSYVEQVSLITELIYCHLQSLFMAS